MDALTQVIETYERNLSLACMDLAVYTPNFEEQLQEWEDNLFDLKVILRFHYEKF